MPRAARTTGSRSMCTRTRTGCARTSSARFAEPSGYGCYAHRLGELPELQSAWPLGPHGTPSGTWGEVGVWYYSDALANAQHEA
jgi:hypothetical protein